MKYKHLIGLLLLFSTLKMSAVETRPVMRRACLNRLDSTLTLQWFRPVDNCASFTSFSIYGRDDLLSVFQYLTSYSDFNIEQISLKLPNLKNWQFFLIYNLTCDGLDSMYSDTLAIDTDPPADSQLDSVSVDLVTQKTILGWSRNSSPDVKDYIVYHVTANNSDISDPDPTGTLYHDLGPRNPGNSSVSYSIAATDSCNNSSLISNPHATMHLRATYDQCSKSINLNWSHYIGWTAESYLIFRKLNNGAYQQVGMVVSNINQFTYSFQNFGDNLCFYIRAIKTGENITSSSNEVCISTNGIVVANNSYIAKASVQNRRVELTFITESTASIEEIVVYKGENAGAFNEWRRIQTGGGILELFDDEVRVHNNTYKYFFRTEGPCNLAFDTSQTAETILLNVLMNQPGDHSLFWTPYRDFIKSVEEQQILLGDRQDFNRGSPWNILQTLPQNVYSGNDQTLFGPNQEQICYCIRAIENNPNAIFTRKDTSYSNIVCLTADPIVFFPNAIQLNGYNTIFFPKGTFIDYEKSSFQIYNRWGEIIFETNDIRRGWDGTHLGNKVVSDVYAYRATIVGLNGTTLYFDGTLTVLK